MLRNNLSISPYLHIYARLAESQLRAVDQWATRACRDICTRLPSPGDCPRRHQGAPCWRRALPVALRSSTHANPVSDTEDFRSPPLDQPAIRPTQEGPRPQTGRTCWAGRWRRSPIPGKPTVCFRRIAARPSGKERAGQA